MSSKQCRGVRGATTVDVNSRESVIDATIELLEAMVRANGIEQPDVASAFFSTTPDINAEFPALAARQIGWTQIAMLCGHEMSVPGSLPHCLRVLLHVNTEKRADEIAHVYLKGAKVLRPDLVEAQASERGAGVS